MPSAFHEALINLFRQRPELAPEVLADLLHMPVPPYSEAELQEADFTQLVPIQYQADLVILLREGVPVFGIVLEIQLQKDPRKLYTWPLYAAALRARYQCPSCVLVYSLDPVVVEWAAQPIPMGAGSTFAPVVLHPELVPWFKEPAEVARAPYLAMLSGVTHATEPGGLEMLLATLANIAPSDDTAGRFYYDLIMSRLDEKGRQELEELMKTKGYEYQSDFARSYVSQGRAEGEAEAILKILASRGLQVPEAIRQQVLHCRDVAQLDRWLTQAVTAGSIQEMFPD